MLSVNVLGLVFFSIFSDLFSFNSLLMIKGVIISSEYKIDIFLKKFSNSLTFPGQSWFSNKFEQNPNHLSLLSYDLVGLIYYLSLKSEATEINKAFNAKNSFKGKIGIFDIEDNKINHRLNFYAIENGKLKEIF